MNHDIERLLHQVRPPGLEPELRKRVLAAVDDELSASGRLALAPARSRRRLWVRPGLATAAALLASLVLNHVVSTTLDRRLEAVLGPRPVPRQAAEIAAEIAAMTDLETGKWALDRLTSRRGSEEELALYPLRLKQMIDQLTAETQEHSHETRQEDLQMDRDRRGWHDRHSPGAQRLLRLEHGNTA